MKNKALQEYLARFEDDDEVMIGIDGGDLQITSITVLPMSDTLVLEHKS